MLARANPNEALVVVRRGVLTDRGLGGRAWLWPGERAVRVPATQQEACFEMTQESSDGIPLRFKGIVLYRIAQPAQAAQRFDFVGGAGLEQIRQRLAHVCLGELRALVAGMTMQACIEGRKTTLTQAVAEGLQRVLHATDPSGRWGLQLDVVQVAQVFIIDEDLRKKLEARVRDKVRAQSELSRLEADERVRLAQLGTERRLAEEGLASERQRQALEQQRLALVQATERARLEAEEPVRRLRTALETDYLDAERAVLRLEAELAELRARAAAQPERVALEMKKELLALEQTTTIAEALAGMWQGTQLSFYGDDAQVLGTVAPVVDLLVRRLRGPGGDESA